jgi:predicted transcriptional regulator
MAKDLTAVRIDGELIEGLKRIAAQPGNFYSERTVSWLISQAVKEFIERRNAKAQA